MPRPHRIDYPGAFHHVMNRGAARQPIFTSDYDRQDFTDHWQEAVSRFGLVVLTYAWLGNHFHALVVSPEGQLSETMRYVSFRYTQRFNRRHGRDGALFRGRFQSIVVDSETYLDCVARYVERNPLEAGLVSPNELPHYRWSGLHHHLKPEPSDWVSTDFLLNKLGSRHRYLSYVLSDQPDDKIDWFFNRELPNGVVLGDQAFVDALPDSVQSLNPLAGIPPVTHEEVEHAITQVLGSRAFNSTSQDVALLLGQQLSRASRADLAERYGFASTDAVSNALSRSRKNPEVTLTKKRVLGYLGRSSNGIPLV